MNQIRFTGVYLSYKRGTNSTIFLTYLMSLDSV
ncbi:uncharacterized protein METZ01_LOCUS266646 [marine metagenome]|jgi:hypothetical protein|uniref:Uncharacterized protein n=1 Tax=marine metagenome TaxID=408172 RepID=A0A382JR39_9ZZZZ